MSSRPSQALRHISGSKKAVGPVLLSSPFTRATVVAGSRIKSRLTSYNFSNAGATPGTFIMAPPAEAKGLTISTPAFLLAFLSVFTKPLYSLLSFQGAVTTSQAKREGAATAPRTSPVNETAPLATVEATSPNLLYQLTHSLLTDG